MKKQPVRKMGRHYISTMEKGYSESVIIPWRHFLILLENYKKNDGEKLKKVEQQKGKKVKDAS